MNCQGETNNLLCTQRYLYFAFLRCIDVGFWDAITGVCSVFSLADSRCCNTMILAVGVS